MKDDNWVEGGSNPGMVRKKVKVRWFEMSSLGGNTISRKNDNTESYQRRERGKKDEERKKKGNNLRGAATTHKFSKGGRRRST